MDRISSGHCSASSTAIVYYTSKIAAIPQFLFLFCFCALYCTRHKVICALAKRIYMRHTCCAVCTLCCYGQSNYARTRQADCAYRHETIIITRQIVATRFDKIFCFQFMFVNSHSWPAFFDRPCRVVRIRFSHITCECSIDLDRRQIDPFILYPTCTSRQLIGLIDSTPTWTSSPALERSRAIYI